MRVMDESGNEGQVNGPWQWVSVKQATALTGLSAATIRRRAHDRQPITLPDGSQAVLESERKMRPQGTRFEIRLPTSLGKPPSDDESDAWDTGVSADQAELNAPADLEQILARLGQMWLEPVLDQLRDERANTVERAEITAVLRYRLEQELARSSELAETNTQLTQRVSQLVAQLAVLERETEELRRQRDLADTPEAASLPPEDVPGAVTDLTSRGEVITEPSQISDASPEIERSVWWRKWLAWAGL